jgi:hypothetical protein
MSLTSLNLASRVSVSVQDKLVEPVCVQFYDS